MAAVIQGNGEGEVLDPVKEVEISFDCASRLYRQGKYEEAIGFFWEIAQKDCPLAWIGLARAHTDGHTIEGYEEKFKLFLPTLIQKAEGDDKIAQYVLGVLYENRYGVKKDTSKACGWYEKSANQNYARAQNNLGVMYEFGRGGVKKSISTARECFKKAAEQGYAEAQYNLGNACAHKRNKKDQDEANKWLKRSAEQNHPLALFTLAPLEIAPPSAAQYYKKAADEGHIDAQFEIGKLYATGKMYESSQADSETLKDQTKAFEYFKRAADQGHVEAQFRVANRYEKGLGVEQNNEAAIQYYEKAAKENHAKAPFRLSLLRAKQGCRDSQYQLANIYECGQEGVDSDVSKALKWYKAAAKKGHYAAHCRLGECYAAGLLGLEKNRDEARQCYECAAELGSGKASAYLGEICEEEGKSDEALKWYEKSVELGCNDARFPVLKLRAQQGDVESQLRLADVYRGGRFADDEGGTHPEAKKNIEQAIVWYEKIEGNARAYFHLAKIYADGYRSSDDRSVIAPNIPKAMEYYRKAMGAKLSGINSRVRGSDAGYPERAKFELQKIIADPNAIAAGGSPPITLEEQIEAQNELGHSYFYGYFRGTARHRDTKEGLKWIEKAAISGFVNAQVSLGIIFLTDPDPNIRNYGNAKRWFEEAKTKSDMAKSCLGLLFEYKLVMMTNESDSVINDVEQARQQYYEAAENQFAFAMVLLGVSYLTETANAMNDGEFDGINDKAEKLFEEAKHEKTKQIDSSYLVKLMTFFNELAGAGHLGAQLFLKEVKNRGLLCAKKEIETLPQPGKSSVIPPESIVVDPPESTSRKRSRSVPLPDGSLSDDWPNKRRRVISNVEDLALQYGIALKTEKDGQSSSLSERAPAFSFIDYMAISYPYSESIWAQELAESAQKHYRACRENGEKEDNPDEPFPEILPKECFWIKDKDRGYPDENGFYWWYAKYTPREEVIQWMQEKDKRYVVRLETQYILSNILPKAQEILQELRKEYEFGEEIDALSLPFPGAGFDAWFFKSAEIQSTEKWPDAEGRHWFRLISEKGEVTDEFYLIKDNSVNPSFSIVHAPTKTEIKGFFLKRDLKEGSAQPGAVNYFIEYIAHEPIKAWVEEKKKNKALWLKFQSDKQRILSAQQVLREYKKGLEKEGSIVDFSSFPSAGFESLEISDLNWQGPEKWPDEKGRHWCQLVCESGQSVIEDFYWMQDKQPPQEAAKDEDHTEWFRVYHSSTGVEIAGFALQLRLKQLQPINSLQEIQSNEGMVTYTECGLIKEWREALRRATCGSLLVGETDFHLAIQANDPSLLAASCLSKPELINSVDEEGNTALHLAIMSDSVDFARSLILYGAQFSIRNKQDKTAQGLLIDKKGGYFEKEEKRKELLALMLTLDLEDVKLSDFGFSFDLIRKITRLKDHFPAINRPFMKGVASIMAKHIQGSSIKHQLDKKTHRESFLAMEKISDLNPLLEITAFAVQGLHRMAPDMARLYGEKNKKLKIILAPYKGDVSSVTSGGTDNAFGVYYHDNAIYLGGNRDKDTERSKVFVRGTLIHEITHFVAKEVFDNGCKPYFKDHKIAIARFTKITNTLHEAVKKNKKNIHERIYSVFQSYKPDSWHAELIVRIPQLKVMGLEDEIAKPVYRELLEYYRDYFLKACDRHIFNLHCEHGILTAMFFNKPEQSVPLLDVGHQMNTDNGFLEIRNAPARKLRFFSSSQENENHSDSDFGESDDDVMRDNPEVISTQSGSSFALHSNQSSFFSSSQNILCEAVVLEDVYPQKVHDLPVRRGDLVSVLEKGDKWWKCEFNGGQGRVPAKCLSVNIVFKPSVEFIAFFEERSKVGYKFKVKVIEKNKELVITCVAAKLGDPLLNFYLDNFKKLLEQQVIAVNETVTMNKEGHELHVKGNANVIKGLAQLLRDIVGQAHSEPQFICRIS
jgi:TPR repeat protein